MFAATKKKKTSADSYSKRYSNVYKLRKMKTLCIVVKIN